ncbi:hypothetical protein VFPPC_16220 [Pochonia chlamydosporia 170]|uniref:Uncharacterized protein n=1 Tax=Pochonia chlamydosporia 170 TaxID=1380566 RepID=A0A179FGF4_METCM|nr:hypothetical protein VFPPC_16220 [Pochonia chlamydosporia 170]OAQ64487.1 hypothetical protein VFPPC_16220 [Pochonia chlamydosporia 170]
MSHHGSTEISGHLAAAEAAFKQFALESWVLTSVAILICALRTYARVRVVGMKNLCVDDYMVWVGVVCYTTLTAMAYCEGTKAKGLANTAMTDAERAALSPMDAEYRQR